MPDPVPDSVEAFTEMVTTEGDAFAATAEIAVAVFALLIVAFEPPVVIVLAEVVCSGWTDQECHVATSLKQPAAEVAANGAGADHENAHWLAPFGLFLKCDGE